MSAFKKLKEKAIAQGTEFYQQLQSETQQFRERQNPAPPYHAPPANPITPGHSGGWHSGYSVQNSATLLGQQQSGHPIWSGQPTNQGHPPPPAAGPTHGPTGQTQTGMYHPSYNPVPPPPPAGNPAPPPSSQTRSDQALWYPPAPPTVSTYQQAPQPGSYPPQQAQNLAGPNVSGEGSVPTYPLPHHAPPGPSYPQRGVTSSPGALSHSHAVDSLSSQLTGITISSSPAQPTHPLTFREPPMAPPAMRQDGEANVVIYDCPGPSRVVDYTATWYHISDVPGFLVCTRCHAKHIANTAHEATFVETRSQGTCRFNVPRVIKSLWPDACRTRDIQPVRNFAIKRSTIPPCPGGSGEQTEDTAWFGIEEHVPGFRACGACYEDYIVGTPFAGYFQSRGRMGGAGPCHMHLPYMVRLLSESFSKPADGWMEFITAVRARMAQPMCNGTPVAADSRTWRRLRVQSPAIVMCEACFLDQVGMTPFGYQFEPIVPASAPTATSTTSRLINALVGPMYGSELRSCHAQVPSIQILLYTAIQRQEFSIFLHGATIIMSSPACTEHGIRNGKWHTLRGAAPFSSFMICTACFAGFVAPYGLGPFFVQTNNGGPDPETRLCAFHPTAPHFAQSFLRLQEAIETGVWSPFSRFASRVDLPPCPRATLVPDRIWYGYQDCGICPACYAEVCEGTTLVNTMPIRAARVTGPTMCSMYSPRMRQMYADACARGNTDELVEYAHTRALAHANTVLKAEAMRQIRDMKMMAAVHQGSVASMYSAGQSFSLAAGTTSAYAYGNSSLGWHPTQSGALAAQAMQNMQTGFATADAPGTALEIAALEARWLEYE